MAEIEEIFEDFLKMLEETPSSIDGVSLHRSFSSVGYFDEHMNAINPKMGLYKLLLERRGFTKTPKIISDDEYERIEEQEFFHGFKEQSHAKAFVFGNKYHLGSGTQIGTYFTENKNESIQYTENKDETQNYVLTAKMYDAKGENYLTILNLLNSMRFGQKVAFNKNSKDEQKIKELIDFCSEDNERQKWDMFLYMTSTAQMLAVYLGYDYLYMQKGDNTHLCVFNRGKIVLSPEKINSGLKLSQQIVRE